MPSCFAACDFPADPEGTLDRVRGGTLGVGVAPAEPWFVLRAGEEPSGVEVELVEQLARTVDAGVGCFAGSESDLMGVLEGRQLPPAERGLRLRLPPGGHVFSVSVLAVPRDETALLDRVEDAVRRICALDWKLQDVVVSVARELEEAPENVLVRPAAS